MDVTNATPAVTNTTSSDFVSNPDSQLTSDDFLKLFMTQLQYQDPTEPMKSEDMLNQESQLTQLQTNQDLKDALNKLTDSLGSSNQYSTTSMIGKMADTGNNGFAITNADQLQNGIPFDLYFNDDYKQADIQIKNANGDVVRSFTNDNGVSGLQSFTWDGKDDNGNPVADGEYYVSSDYTTTNNEKKSTRLGVYPIESVRFDSGKALLNVDNKYIPLDSIKEVF